MNTLNNAAALERLELISREMRERRVNHGKHTSPTLVAWAARIDAELATLRATLAQPDALTSQPSGEVVAARLTVYADTTAITARIHDVAHCLAPGTYNLYLHPSADAPGVAVDEWTDAQCVAFMSVALRHVEYKRGSEGPTCDDIRFGVKFALRAALAPKPEGGHG